MRTWFQRKVPTETFIQVQKPITHICLTTCPNLISRNRTISYKVTWWIKAEIHLQVLDGNTSSDRDQEMLLRQAWLQICNHYLSWTRACILSAWITITQICTHAQVSEASILYTSYCPSQTCTISDQKTRFTKHLPSSRIECEISYQVA